MRVRASWLFVCAALLASCAPAASRPDLPALQRQVEDTERAFAKTMADRDFEAFKSFVSKDAVFMGGKSTLRGREQVAEAWKKFFADAAAPFSWEPARVEVQSSGTLALSTGPVYDPSGKPIAHFMSIWRLEAPGAWRIIFDTGEDACDCAKP